MAVAFGDDRVCSDKENPLIYIEYSISLNKILKFTLETTNAYG